MTAIAGAAEPPIVDSRIAALWTHWLRARGGRRMPTRQAIDPLAIPLTLPLLYLYDFDAASGRFFCRIAGEEVQAGSGIRGTRRHLDELFPESAAPAIAARFRRVVEGPAIVYACGLMRSAAGHVMPIERLVLPLSDTGAAATGLVGATLYRRGEALDALADPRPALAEEQYFTLPEGGPPDPG
jgi:hypothetical protein